MAKVISQETFDDVVKENIVEFSMTIEEAKNETIEQFEAQGINLANIIKDLSINEDSGRPILLETVEKLKSTDSALSTADLIELLKTLSIECGNSIPHRVMAAENGAKDVVLNLLEKCLEKKSDSDLQLEKALLKCWIELTNKQPDIFDDRCLAIVIQILTQHTDGELICDALNLLKHAAFMHEFNRQNMINADLLKSLCPLIHKEEKVLKETCAVFRHLILDDDIRVEFSKAHDHARAIAAEVLAELTQLLTAYSQNTNILSDLILTIASLTVRHEFCLVVEEAGGLKFLMNAMREHSDSIRLTREALKLLRALAGNDSVKINIIKDDAAELINGVLNLHKENEAFAKIGLLCISTLTLRSKDNSEAFFEVGVSETIVDTMKLHPECKLVQRNGAWAIRNMVSRSRHQCPQFVSQGAEESLRDAMQKFPDIGQDIKAALRDLGSEVVLKEEWTGTNKIRITN